MAKKADCFVPDFSNISGTNVEETTMEMAFNASRINDLTDKLNVATPNKIDEIVIERECYLRKLKNNIADFEDDIIRIPLNWFRQNKTKVGRK